MGWIYDMSDAPKGAVVYSTRKSKSGEDIEFPNFVPDYIIACAGDEKKTVTKTRWLPKERRWEFFATGEEPFAWMPWPEHPNAEGV